MAKSRIFILYTGGTIGMAPENPTEAHSPLVPKSWNELQRYMPAIQSGGYFTRVKDIEFEYHSFEEVADSSQFNTSHWIKMAGEIEKRYDAFNGFIIIHGTDTMAYTASGLSFLLENLDKPVVLTGSQLPISHSRTDAINNLSNAIHIASAASFGLEPVNEVTVCFSDRLFRGNRCTKASTNDFDGFLSPNYPPLAELKQQIRIKSKYLLEEPKKAFKCHRTLNTNVLEIGLFPGLKAHHLRKLIIDQEVDGLILKAYGSGNAPCNAEFIAVLSEAIEAGTYIMFITQCLQGAVEIGKYGASSIFRDLQVISGFDMTPEAALAKMMFVLDLKLPRAETIQMLETDLRGESNPS